MRLAIGDAAPDLPLLTETGAEVRLSTLWRSEPIFLNFVRHFG